MLGLQTIKITPTLMLSSAKIDEFKGRWAGLEQYTTGLQVLADVAAHGENVQKILRPLKDKTITPDIIQLLHGIQTGDNAPVGYKEQENTLTIMHDDEIAGTLDTASPEQVTELMKKLVDWLNTSLENKDTHPLITIAVFTAVFLQISPFEKHNMRSVRFLILLLMLKAGYSYAPYVPLDRIMSEHGEELYNALKHNQNSLEIGTPDWSQWLSYFFSILNHQAHTLYTRLESKDKDLSKLPTLSAKVLKLFEEHTRLQMNDIERLTRGRRSTLKLRLGELIDDGYLRRHGKARSTWYSQV